MALQLNRSGKTAKPSSRESSVPQYFSSQQWLEYFQDNKKNRLTITFPQSPAIPAALRVPLVRSLQRFQIGETGEGKHLKKYAATIGDPAYESCIDLFVKEEQSHATVLAGMIGALEAELLTWHWTDVAFVALRRMFGLKTEVFILLIAEIIGKCFYKQCADHLPDERMSTAFSLIVLDEIAHLEFHSTFLHTQTKRLGCTVSSLVLLIWTAMFYGACTVFVLDHGATLAALGVSSRSFLHDCAATFRRAAQRALPLATRPVVNKPVSDPLPTAVNR